MLPISPNLDIVLRTFLQSKTFLVSHHIESYNIFLKEILPKIVQQPIYLEHVGDASQPPLKAIASFNSILIDYPVVPSSLLHKQPPILPMEARHRNLTYAANVYVCAKLDIVDDFKTQNIISSSIIKGIRLCSLPTLLQGYNCNLTKTKNNKECELDVGGYFIVNGKERVLISHERLNYNTVYTYFDCTTKTRNPKDLYYSEIRSIDPKTSRSVIIKISSTNDVQDISFYFSLFGQEPKTKLPLGVILKALEIPFEMCVSIVTRKQTHPRLKEFCNNIYHQAEFIKNSEEALLYLGKIFLGLDDTKKSLFLLLRDLFPHLGNVPAINKKVFLCYMIQQYFLVLLGEKQLADRDHYLNKRIEATGALYHEIFKMNYKRYIKSIQKICRNYDHFISFEKTFIESCKQSYDTLTNSLYYHFKTGNWVPQKINNPKIGVAQIITNLSDMSRLSHLRRLTASIGKKGKLVLVRQFHPSQEFRLCPNETPEGKPCGINKNFALGARITTSFKYNIIEELLEDYLIPIDDDFDAKEYEDTSYVMLNGNMVGFTDRGYDLIEFLKTKRSEGIIGHDVSLSISYQKNNSEDEIRIFTDAGRVSYPVVKLNNGRLPKISSFQEMLSCGDIIYLDSAEEENAIIASNEEDLTSDRTDFTHILIHPSLMLGIVSCMAPFTNHNQGPRNIYQASMRKQAIGIYAMNYQKKFDNCGHVMWYPQKTTTPTIQEKYLSMDAPSGQSLIVMYNCYGGFNQEDSVIFNKASIDRGAMRVSTYSTICVEEAKMDDKLVRFRIPPPSVRKNGKYYGKLDDDGIVSIGSVISEGDVLIGIICGNNNDPEEKLRDESLIARKGDEGVVDKVMLTTGPSGYRMCKILMRKMRILEIGDKVASCHAQKGTVGIIYPEEDMPFTTSGIRPDLIFNVHGFPSRMTYGMILETVFGKAALLNGLSLESTTFEHRDMHKIKNLLKTKGFCEQGQEVIYNGMTGEMMDSKYVFMGPVYYQRLKHMVSDKIHARTYGKIQQLTCQPNEGRSRNGGLRFGEMENSCMAAHGAAYTLNDRLFEQSDPFTIPVCQECHMIANGNVCKCSVNSKINIIKVPYAYKYLIQEISALGIRAEIIRE